MSRNACNNERSRLDRRSSREGYRQSGDSDESGEFGENDEFDEISPKIEISMCNQMVTSEIRK